MICVIYKPHADGDYHDPFEFDYVLGIDDPGKKRSCKDRKPGYGVKGDCSEGENNGKGNKKKLERNGSFELKENHVSDDAYNSCDNAAHSSEKIMGNTHKGKLYTLRNKDFIFIFDKSDKHHHGAGDNGNYICDNYAHGYASL